MSDIAERIWASVLYVWEYNDAVERFKMWQFFEGTSWDDETTEKITIRRPVRSNG